MTIPNISLIELKQKCIEILYKNLKYMLSSAIRSLELNIHGNQV